MKSLLETHSWIIMTPLSTLYFFLSNIRNLTRLTQLYDGPETIDLITGSEGKESIDSRIKRQEGDMDRTGT